MNRKKTKNQLVRANVALLKSGMANDAIWELFEEAMAEALIQHNLPACGCQDTNQCETWCRAKARFVLNLPE